MVRYDESGKTLRLDHHSVRLDYVDLGRVLESPPQSRDSRRPNGHAQYRLRVDDVKLPAMQFYPGDWKKDPGVQSLDHYERNVWFEMILIMWESEERGKLLLNGKPIDTEALGLLIHVPEDRLTKILTKLVERGVASVEPNSGVLYCRRMVRDEEIRRMRQSVGKLGGNPRLVNQNSNQNGVPVVNQNSTPSSSYSSSVSKEKKENGKPHSAPTAEDLFERLWNAYPSKGRLNRTLAEQALVDLLIHAPNPSAHDELSDMILAPVVEGGKWAESKQWKDGYVFSVDKYIRDKRWRDTPEPAESKPIYAERRLGSDPEED